MNTPVGVDEVHTFRPYKNIYEFRSFDLKCANVNPLASSPGFAYVVAEKAGKPVNEANY